MIPVRSFVVRLFCCLAVPLAVASGQRDLKPNLDLAVEVWGGRAQGQVFSHSGGVAAAAFSSWHIRTFPKGAVIVGGGIGVQKLITCCADKCVLNPGSPGCAPDYPAFSSLMAHVGVEGNWGATVRVLAGLAVFHSGTGTVPGLHGRADFATPTLAHLALVLSARGAMLPRFQGRRYEIAAIGVGIRVGN